MAVQRIQMDICMEFGGTQYPMDKIRAAIKDRVVTKFPDCKVKKIVLEIVYDKDVPGKSFLP